VVGVSDLRPTFNETIKAIDGYALREGDTDSEQLADALVLTQEVHRSLDFDADASGHYGVCDACELPWPCPTWGVAHRAAVEWLIAVSTARVARVRERLAA